MITDREECYQTEKIVSNAGMNPAMFHLIRTSEHFGDGGVDILHPIVGIEFANYFKIGHVKVHFLPPVD